MSLSILFHATMLPAYIFYVNVVIQKNMEWIQYWCNQRCKTHEGNVYLVVEVQEILVRNLVTNQITKSLVTKHYKISYEYQITIGICIGKIIEVH